MLLTPKHQIRIGTWNARTLYQLGKTTQLAREIKRSQLAIIGVSKIWWTNFRKTAHYWRDFSVLRTQRWGREPSQILSTQEEQLSRWREHSFKEVLNGEPPTEELQVKQNQEELDINVGEITKGEVLRSIKSLKNGKKLVGLTTSLQKHLRQETACQPKPSWSYWNRFGMKKKYRQTGRKVL